MKGGVARPKIKARSVSKLKKELDMWFSRFIRWRDSGQCYTCPKKDDPKRMQCGHFVPRQYLATRYDEVNCQTQCYACNMLYNGQPSAFALRLDQDYGAGTAAKLEARRQTITKDFPYETFINLYQKKAIELGWA